LGVLGVWFSRDSAHHKAAADQPTVNDHWHAAYGWDVCGTFLPDLPQPQNLIGLHTHGDGVIHIEPVDPILDTGKHATLGRFISGYPGLSLTQTKLTIINEPFKNGDKPQGCDKPGTVQVVRNGVAVTSSFSSVRVPKDGWITVAFVPKGTKIPAPPNWKQRVETADGTKKNFNMPGTTLPGTPTTSPPTSVPAPTTPPTSAPAGTATTRR
ncbi:MAG TPA: hypothetical protein VJ456_11970, partial [Acidimicrobiia bacterium]|nr:hypothetical protein [Acidimicrobiia bacterium]